MWSLSDKDKHTYKMLTNHAIVDEEINEVRRIVVEKGLDGPKVCKTVSLVELLSRRVFTPKERENLDLAIYDPSILTLDTSSKMHLDNLDGPLKS